VHKVIAAAKLGERRVAAAAAIENCLLERKLFASLKQDKAATIGEACTSTHRSTSLDGQVMKPVFLASTMDRNDLCRDGLATKDRRSRDHEVTIQTPRAERICQKEEHKHDSPNQR
jgi:hypothetical protein